MLYLILLFNTQTNPITNAEYVDKLGIIIYSNLFNS